MAYELVDGNMRSTLSRTVASALLTLAALTPSAFAETEHWADTALLADFRKICVDTQLEPAGVRDAAARAGATLKRNGLFSGAPVTSWIHATSGHVINVSFQDLRKNREASFSAICTAEDFQERDGRSLHGIQRWLGTSASDTANPFGFAEHRFVIVGERPRLFEGQKSTGGAGRASPAYRTTIMAGTGGTHLTLSRYK